MKINLNNLLFVLNLDNYTCDVIFTKFFLDSFNHILLIPKIQQFFEKISSLKSSDRSIYKLFINFCNLTIIKNISKIL